MRNVERIDVVCQLLAKYWKKMPDYRLGQLLWAIAGRDPFHIEDYDFIVGLAKKVGEEEPDVSGFPDYWVEPNEMRLFISSMINKERVKKGREISVMGLCPECGEPYMWSIEDTGERCCLRCGTKESDYDIPLSKVKD